MTNEEVVRKVLEAYAKNSDEMLQYFSDDAIYDNVPDEKPMEGKAAIKAWLDMVFTICYIDAEILNIASSGEWVLTERIDVHVAGDKHMRLPVMGAARVVDGKIVMWRDYYCRKTVDALGLTGEALAETA